MRGRDLTAFTPQELLAAWGDQFQLSGRTLLNLVIAGRATLFFEGFDEINNAGVQSSRARQFNRLWNFAYPAAKLVLTGRTNFFLDTDELRHLLREDESQAPIANINSRVLTLELFNRDEVAEALRAFPSEDRNEIVSEFDRNANFRDIASRPSILPLIASIWKSIVSQTGSSNTLTSAGIIDKYVHAEYGRKLKAVEDDIIQSGGRRDESYMKIPLRIKEFYMMCVARNMARSARPNSISNDELSTTVAEATKYAEAYVASRTSLPEELDYFKVLQSALAENEPEAMERTVSEIRTTGLLADDLAAGAGRLHFPHRQFYEYYLARFCIVACDARLARQQSESFNRFLSTTRPCAVLSREKQAMKFFAELANPAWFQSVFTTTKMKQARMAISAVAAIVVPSSAGLRRTSIVEDIRRVSQSMETFDLGKIGTGALGAVAIIVLMSITTYFAVHYTLQTLGLLSIIGAYGWSAFVLANSTSVIADVAQWCRIAREKFGPLEAMEIQERALGKVTFRAWRLLVTRGASIGIQLESDNRSD